MRFLSLRSIWCASLLVISCGVSASMADAPAAPWVPTVGIIAIPKNATSAHRGAATRLALAFGGSVVSVDGPNPVCCVWLDLRLPVPTPGRAGYIVLHQAGGSTVTASDQAQLDAAVTRMVTISKVVGGVRVLPEGIISSFPAVAP
jgi:hypothetical protein